MKKALPVILVFITCGISGVSYAASWNFEVIESPPFYDLGHWYESSLAVTSGGMPRIAYSNTGRPAGGRLLMYAAKDQSGWRIEYADGKHDAECAFLVLDSSGLPHISYSRGSMSGLFYAHSDGGSWLLETINDASGHKTLILSSSLALAADGPCASYTYLENDTLQYSYRRGTEWFLKHLNREGLNQGGISSLAIDPQDVSHVVYLEEGQGELWHAAGKDGEPWDYEKISSEAWLHSPAALKCDSSGRLHLCYLKGPTLTSSLYYACRDDSGWHHEAVFGELSTGAQLALDSSGMPHILYYYGYKDLMYAYKDGAGWHTENVSAAASYHTFYAGLSLAVDSSNRPHVSTNDQFGLVYGRRWFGLALDCSEPSAWGKGIKVDVNWSFRAITGTVDAYLAIKLPGGALLFLNPGLKGQTKVVPIARRMQVSGDMRGTVSLHVGSKPPAGDYTFMAVCVSAGSPVTNFANHLGDGINNDVVDVD